MERDHHLAKPTKTPLAHTRHEWGILAVMTISARNISQLPAVLRIFAYWIKLRSRLKLTANKSVEWLGRIVFTIRQGSHRFCTKRMYTQSLHEMLFDAVENTHTRTVKIWPLCLISECTFKYSVLVAWTQSYCTDNYVWHPCFTQPTAPSKMIVDVI